MVRRLQKELRQTRAFASPEEEVYLSILRTAERLVSGFTEVLKQSELTPTQYNALRILRGAGAEGASCRDIGERMVTKDSDITRLLDRLEARGLISRERAGDRRFIITRITDEGLRMLAQLDAPVAEQHRRQLGHMGEKKLVALRTLLDEARAVQS
ncbi:MAG TPA: MarR family transcriptional regulator [Pyrinomonadaceae bacterium]|nr:MarR family transcriptional regulator [Pyrinomonadaceae bacterium]